MLTGACYLIMCLVSYYHIIPDFLSSLIAFPHALAVWRYWVAPGRMWLCSCNRPSPKQTERQTAFFLSGSSDCCCSCLSVCCCCSWLSTSAGSSDRVGMLLTFHVKPMSRSLAMLYLQCCRVAKWILWGEVSLQGQTCYKYKHSSPHYKDYCIKRYSKRYHYTPLSISGKYKTWSSPLYLQKHTHRIPTLSCRGLILTLSFEQYLTAHVATR